jgi:streptogramin lyase
MAAYGDGIVGDAEGVAVDKAGNIYIANAGYGNVTEWFPSPDFDYRLLGIPGLNTPLAVALDGGGNVYVADAATGSIFKWTATNGPSTTLVNVGNNWPDGVAVDEVGNVYISINFTSTIQEWTRADSNLTTLVSSGLNSPGGIAVDCAGNVYIADTGNNAIKEWTAANSNVITLVSSGLSMPSGVAVDGSGNVYIADPGNLAVEEWSAVNGTVTQMPFGPPEPYDPYSPEAVAVDGVGSVYIGNGNEIDELPYAFVDTSGNVESAAPGNDSLPVVLPVTASLIRPFAPSTEGPWLTITGITNGVVGVSFPTNAGPPRTALIYLLGQVILNTTS